MLSRRILMGLTLVAMLASGVPLAWADDFAPAPWRGESLPFKTLQGWEFLTPGPPGPKPPDDPAIAPIVGDGGGVPAATIFGLTWVPGDGDGGWLAGPGGGGIDLYIPNWIDFEPIKLIRVQFTFVGPAPFVAGIDGFDNVVGGVIGGTVLPPVVVDPIHVYEDWYIIPNPNHEVIHVAVPPNTFVDEIVVDTISVPEPASMALVGMAGLCLALRRRK